MPTFPVSGFKHASWKARRLVKKHLKPGMPVQLRADPNNPYDTEAVEVFQDHHIGWISSKAREKADVFHLLQEGREIKAECERNEMIQVDYERFRSIIIYYSVIRQKKKKTT